jgi:response regulator NasT
MQPHLVLIDYSDPMRDSIEQFCCVPLGSTSPLLLLAQHMDTALMDRLRQAGLVVYSGSSTESAQVLTLMPVLDMMLARERHLRHQVDALQLELADRRDIERAKDYLTLKLQCSGDDAYTALRKRAMKERTTLGDLARAILTHRSP